MTKTGKAADAKITGDKLATLKEKDDAVDAEISSLKESLGNYQDINNNRFEHESIDNGSTIKTLLLITTMAVLFPPDLVYESKLMLR